MMMLICRYLYKTEASFLHEPHVAARGKFRECKENCAVWYPSYFFLDGVIEIAGEAIDVAAKITELRERDMAKIQSLDKLSSKSAVLVLPKLYGQPIVTVALIQKWTGFTRAGAKKMVDRFMDMGILSPKNADKKYGQSYIYKDYIDIFL